MNRFSLPGLHPSGEIERTPRTWLQDPLKDAWQVHRTSGRSGRTRLQKWRAEFLNGYIQKWLFFTLLVPISESSFASSH